MVEGPYATYDLPPTSIMWAAAVVKVMTRRQSNDYGTEISTEKSKIMANSTNNKCMDEQKLEEVTSVKYLRAASCKDGTCSVEVRIRTASAIAAMARVNRVWRC